MVTFKVLHSKNMIKIGIFPNFSKQALLHVAHISYILIVMGDFRLNGIIDIQHKIEVKRSKRKHNTSWRWQFVTKLGQG